MTHIREQAGLSWNLSNPLLLYWRDIHPFCSFSFLEAVFLNRHLEVGFDRYLNTARIESRPATLLRTNPQIASYSTRAWNQTYEKERKVNSGNWKCPSVHLSVYLAVCLSVCLPKRLQISLVLSDMKLLLSRSDFLWYEKKKYSPIVLTKLKRKEEIARRIRMRIRILIRGEMWSRTFGSSWGIIGFDQLLIKGNLISIAVIAITRGCQEYI